MGFSCNKSVKSYSLYRTNSGDNHGWKKQNQGYNEESKDVEYYHDLPMPAYRYETHVIIMRIKPDNLKAILQVAQSNSNDVTNYQALSNK